MKKRSTSATPMRLAPIAEAPEASERGNDDSKELSKVSKRRQHLRNFAAGKPSQAQGKKRRRALPGETGVASDRPDRLCMPPFRTRSYIGHFQAAGPNSRDSRDSRGSWDVEP